jgi:hypothetical protein
VGEEKMASFFTAKEFQFFRRFLIAAFDRHRQARAMKLKFLTSVFALIALPLFAADVPTDASTGWHAHTLPQAIGLVLLFAAIGIFAAIVGFKAFDKCTPGNLQKEILENKNLAAAVVAAAVIIGVSIIIAAAMIG